MGLLSFLRRSKPPAHAPVEFPGLGTLSWSRDVEGWIGRASFRGAEIELYIGSGSESEPPQPAACELLHEALLLLTSKDSEARERLADSAKAYGFAGLHFELTGLETYDHYVHERTASFVYSDDKNPGRIWRVNIVDGKVGSAGFDG